MTGILNSIHAREPGLKGVFALRVPELRDLCETFSLPKNGVREELEHRLQLVLNGLHRDEFLLAVAHLATTKKADEA